MKLSGIIGIIGISLCLTLSCLRPTYALTTEDFASSYQNSKTEQGKLEVLVKSIENGNISKNAPLSELEQIINQKNKYLPKKGILGTGLNTIFPDSRSDMFLSYKWNSERKIVRYSITNCDLKHAPYLDEQPSSKLKRTLIARYREARSENDRLFACFEIMSNHVIYPGISLKVVDKIFKPNLTEKEIPSGAKVYISSLGSGTNSWRFYFFKDKANLGDYWLSNQADYFDDLPDSWWPKN